MPCAQHAFFHSWCHVCREAETEFAAQDRHREHLRQLERHHRERMTAQRRRQRDASRPSPSPGRRAGGSVTGVVSALGLALFGAVMVILIAIVVLVAIVLQVLLVGLVLGGLAGGVTYVVLRFRRPEVRFALTLPPRSVPIRARFAAGYASLDPTTRTAAAVGGAIGVVAALLAILL